jgi:very-short-patch-repair endonuclease
MVHGITPPIAEYRFHAVRKWRFDFAWPANEVALEVEGGIWTNGRHTRGAGFARDLEKYNTAAAMGWRILRCQPRELLSSRIGEMLRTALADGGRPAC